MTWVILVVQILFVIWLIAGISAVSKDTCSTTEYSDACQRAKRSGQVSV